MPFTAFTGIAPSSSTPEGAPFRRSVSSVSPIFCVPIGRMKFWAASAVATSCAESPRACSAAGSMSICMKRALPPKGSGIAAPGTVTSRVRTTVMATSPSACSVMPLPESAICRMGTVEAL